MLSVYIRPDFSPDRDRMLGAIRGQIEAAVARGSRLSAELCMDAAASVVDGMLIEFGGHVRAAAFDHAFRWSGPDPTPSSSRACLADRTAREEARAEALDEVRLAFASHGFRTSSDACETCTTCGLGRDHDVHLASHRGTTTVDMIKDVLGQDFPIAGTWSGHLNFDADRYAEEAGGLGPSVELPLAAE